MIMNNIYAQKVDLLLRIIPIIFQEKSFAIHGGTAINLFEKAMLRYSVDIDITYVPLEDRKTSIQNINQKLKVIAERIERTLKGGRVSHREDICKLLCEYRGKQVKIEVNQTKRGIICGEVVSKPLCKKAQEEFQLYCEANIVPYQQLYGGKVAAALSRQHPRDLFDIKYMDATLSDIKEGIIFSLLGSDRPISESIAPNLVDQRQALKNQFAGMTELEFTYSDFEQTRDELIHEINQFFSIDDKSFLLSFESGNPDWTLGYETFKDYPSVQWKLFNIEKLRKSNPRKFDMEIERLRLVLG